MLVTVAAGFGFVCALREPEIRLSDKPQNDLLKARLDALDLALAQLRERSDLIDTRVQQAVSKDELAHTLDRVLGKIERDVDSRFDRQARSVEALRVMVGQTDELLQKVLDGLDSLRSERDLTETR